MAATNYYDDLFLNHQVEVNENGIVIDFDALHARERGYAIAGDENLLRGITSKEAGIDWEDIRANGWSSITDAQAEEAEILYLSARHGEAQLRYDEIMMERHRADWDKYY